MIVFSKNENGFDHKDATLTDMQKLQDFKNEMKRLENQYTSQGFEKMLLTLYKRYLYTFIKDTYIKLAKFESSQKLRMLLLHNGPR